MRTDVVDSVTVLPVYAAVQHLPSLATIMSDAMRNSLANKLNKMIDMPFLGESQEQMAIEHLIDALLGPIEQAAPNQSELDAAAGNAQKTQSIKAGMIDKLNKMIDIPFANEEQEAMALGLAVDYFLKDKMGQQQQQQQQVPQQQDEASQQQT